jgi:N-acetylmuramoyl-L-alanine amidase-like protein
MAKSLIVALVGIWALVVVGGCQQPKSTVITKLPVPNLDGPVVNGGSATVQHAKGAAPATRPVVAQAPVTVAQRGKSGAGVPQEWLINVPANRWQYIVIHHSATPAGNAASFDRMHKAKGWDELGYHFVIGNGTSSGDGQIEVGPRWPKQKWGAHAKTADQRFNNYGIGVCLVGNFDIERPSSRQMESVARLVGYLMKTYRIPASRVVAHSETKATECPGRHMSVAEVRRMAGRLVEENDVPVEVRHVAGVEMLKSVE